MTADKPHDLAPFFAMEILARAKAREAAGQKVFHLEVGEPGAPPSPRVREAVSAAIAAPQGYTLAKGTRELRGALAARYRAQYRVEVDPERIVVTMGSSAGFVLAFLAGFAPGARIAVTRPGYPAYLNILIGLGFEPVEIALSADSGWRLSADDVERAHKETPFDGLLFASPANPTGAAVSGDALAAIVARCRTLGVRLISDEIYHGLQYNGRSVSALEHDGDVIVVNSFSKYFCMTGWRLGWLVLPQDMVRKTEILQQNLFISAATPSQVAGLAALGDLDWPEQQKAVYAVNRSIVADALSAAGFDTAPADGAFYTLIDISALADDALAFCEEVLSETGVALTPGIDFDRVDGHRFVRLSYAGDTEKIRAAMARFSEYVTAARR